MRIFISFASEQDKVAEAIYRKLLAAGYDVFYSSEDIVASEGYDERIRRAMAEADRFIFLASKDSLAEGRYTRTELEMASQQWPDPTGRVLPVMIGDVSYDDVPPYLGAVTSALTPKGNVASEVVATVVRTWPASGGAIDQRSRRVVGGVLVLFLLSLGAWMLVSGRASSSTFLHVPTKAFHDAFPRSFAERMRGPTPWSVFYKLLDIKVQAQASREVLALVLAGWDRSDAGGDEDGRKELVRDLFGLSFAYQPWKDADEAKAMLEDLPEESRKELEAALELGTTQIALLERLAAELPARGPGTATALDAVPTELAKAFGSTFFSSELGIKRLEQHLSAAHATLDPAYVVLRLAGAHRWPREALIWDGHLAPNSRRCTYRLKRDQVALWDVELAPEGEAWRIASIMRP